MGATPNAYSTYHYMTTCGSDGNLTEPERLVFGFPATSIHVFNSCGDRVFFSLQSTATTDMDFIAGCSALTLSSITPVGSISLKTTSTSTCTGLPGARPHIGVSAWASA